VKKMIKKENKQFYGAIIIISGCFIVSAIYILLFLPELWDPIEIINLCILIYLFVLAHHVPDKDAKEKMTNVRKKTEQNNIPEMFKSSEG